MLMSTTSLIMSAQSPYSLPCTSQISKKDMKFLYDFFPILLFFIAYKTQGIYVATAVAIVASIIQVGYMWFKNRRVETMHLVTLGLIVVLGGATLIFQDEDFIKWKPTIVNWAFALAFLGSQFIGKKPFVRRIMESNITLKDEAIWSRLNTIWAAFFVAMGVVNLYVAFNYDTDTWVNFKLFGMMGLTLLFVVLQGVYLVKHIENIEEETPDKLTGKEEKSSDFQA